MKKTIAAAAITVIVMGTGSAYAEEGNVHPGELPGGIAHSPNDTGPVSANNADHAVSFKQFGGQIAHPPSYKPYYDRANHIVTLRYTPPVVAPNYAHGVVTNNSNHG